MSGLSKLLSFLLALLLGGLLAEGFLRLLVPVEAHFETWFTPGIEEWDPAFGAVYRPFWAGTIPTVSTAVFPSSWTKMASVPPSAMTVPGNRSGSSFWEVARP